MRITVREIAHFLFGPKDYKKDYFTHTMGQKHLLCKILNEYENEEEAENDLINLVVYKKTERELLQDFQMKKSW